MIKRELELETLSYTQLNSQTQKRVSQFKECNLVMFITGFHHKNH